MNTGNHNAAQSADSAKHSAWSALADLASILRLHIIFVAMAGALVFSWLLYDRFVYDLALIGGVDWMLINLLNRITDLKEDLANKIRGTEHVARKKSAFVIAFAALFISSFAFTTLVYPEITVLRIVVQIIGLGYSISFVPTFSGLRRFKDIYFFKNFMSSVLFVLTIFVYPGQAFGWDFAHGLTFATLASLVLFFVPFELTFEILYDMRDLEGDRLAKVPTYPVVHGIERSRQIIDGLLIGSWLILAGALLAGFVGLREGLILVAPMVQFVFYRPRYKRGLTSWDCILLTHQSTALLLFYLAGNQVWLACGMPDNIFLYR